MRTNTFGTAISFTKTGTCRHAKMKRPGTEKPYKIPEF